MEIQNNVVSQVKRFSDFAQGEFGLEGEKKPIADILNKEICVTGFRIMDGKHPVGKELLQLQYKLEGVYYITFTNGIVLIKQIKQYKEEIPFVTTIKKFGNYYTFQ